MHKEIGQKINFLTGKSQHFIAFIGPLLRPLCVEQDRYVFKAKEPIEDIFFLIKGQAAFVLDTHQDEAYLLIDEGMNFGEMDFIYLDQNGNSDGRRKFTVLAQEQCDLLALDKQDLSKVDTEFEEIMAQLFQLAQLRLPSILRCQQECQDAIDQRRHQHQHQK